MILGVDASNLTAGGGARYVRVLMGHARQSGFDELLVFGPADLAADAAGGAGGRVRVVAHPLLSGPRWSRSPLGAGAGRFLSLLTAHRWRNAILPGVLAAEGVDVLLSPGGLLPPAWPGRTRTASMARNMLPFQPEEARRYRPGWRRLRLALLRRLQLDGFRRADLVLFPSRHARDAVGRLMADVVTRSAVVPNGVDERIRRPPAAGRPGPGPVTVLYVSGLDLYKHQWHVVAALARLRAGGRDLRLRLVGWVHRPGLRRLRRAMAGLGMTGHVQVDGPVPAAELPAIYHGASLFVFASSCENCPTTLLEAMAAGLPIACSDRPPMPEFAADAACYFDPEDPPSIAAALARLLDDGTLAQALAWRAFRLAAAYTEERCARETFAAVAGLARPARPLASR